MPINNDKPRAPTLADEPAALGFPPPLAPPCCPHCGTELVAHPLTGPKAGAKHCDACGCCWLDGTVRAGHGSCRVEG